MTHVAVGIIIKDGNPKSYLLVNSNRNFGEYTGFYYPPAGHIENGESGIDALGREIKEELGVNLVGAKKITDDIKSDIKNQKTSWYLCKIDSFNFTVDHDELRDIGFFTEQEMKSMKIWPGLWKTPRAD